MSRLDDEIEKLEARKKNTRFGDLVRLCQEYFGRERIKGSHRIFKMPWPAIQGSIFRKFEERLSPTKSTK